MAEMSSPRTSCRSTSASPPPKCAICLGTCTNICYSNSCMHQFCFTCLLEWSKVKAECPLCKQTFKSIIHNIKSNSEYDEHVITRPELPMEDQNIHINNPFLFIPPAPPRHFQFRTTFTVDHGGELAIQQMLLSHPIINNLVYIPGSSTRRTMPATSFRRSIYAQNLWVYVPPDVTGRTRNISPAFFREHPAARNRLVPWLNRELNALLQENTQQVMHLVDRIMDYLLRYYIRSSQFRNMLVEYFEDKTDHFIHEFYNFMRSPFDMVGYDRHIMYTGRSDSPTLSVSDDSSSDSDVAIINEIPAIVTSDDHPFRSPTLEVIEINSDDSRDSDVIVRTPTPPEIVDLVDSDSSYSIRPLPLLNSPDTSPFPTSDSESDSEEPLLPIKLRLKRKRQLLESKTSTRLKKKRKRCCSSSSSTSTNSFTCSSSSTISTSTSSSSSGSCLKRKLQYKIFKHTIPSKKLEHESPKTPRKKRPLKKKDKEKKKKNYGKKALKRIQSTSSDENLSPSYSPSYTPPPPEDLSSSVESYNIGYTSVNKEETNNNNKNDSNNLRNQLLSSMYDEKDLFKNYNANEQDYEQVDYKPIVGMVAESSNPGPSRGRLRSVIVKKENSNLWYSRPFIYDSDSN